MYKVLINEYVKRSFVQTQTSIYTAISVFIYYVMVYAEGFHVEVDQTCVKFPGILHLIKKKRAMGTNYSNTERAVDAH